MNQSKTKKIAAATIFLLIATFTACKKEKNPEPELIAPSISNVEIGLNNNEIGVIGQDFHFNADITAGDKIDEVEVSIQQKAGETYSRTWTHTVTWTQYKGSKNTNIHKHFDIPEDAIEGKYDFLITVTDENGSKLEEKRSITLYSAENVPVNPAASIFNLHVNGARFYRNGKFLIENPVLKKGHVLGAQVTISDVKGTGKMYLLLINKKHNHRPESIDKIDFSKAIVYDVYEHKDQVESFYFTNTPFDANTSTVLRSWPDLTIGGITDNNVPNTPIEGARSWETGVYYFGVVYLNTTYRIGYYKYIEVPIEIS